MREEDTHRKGREGGVEGRREKVTLAFTLIENRASFTLFSFVSFTYSLPFLLSPFLSCLTFSRKHARILFPGISIFIYLLLFNLYIQSLSNSILFYLSSFIFHAPLP